MSERKWAATRTCQECPWIKSSPVGKFPPERYKALEETCKQGFGHKVFACHMSPEGEEYACAGFILAEGSNNFEVRMAAGFRQLFDPNEIKATGELYSSFAEMAAANGYTPESEEP